jgi:NCAIR mutase (PurE)-related protein
MDLERLKHLASQFLQGAISPEQLVSQIASPKTADLGEVQLDLDRRRRCGYPEVIYGAGKPLSTMLSLAERMLAEQIDVFATRVAPDIATALQERFPNARYNAVARTLRIPTPQQVENNSPAARGQVLVVTAGTTDRPVAEEAFETAAWMGAEVSFIQDVGVAGPHRLSEHLAALEKADAIVVVAGMEGALPSVVGGYVACPVIAVPTSVGYGASLGGLTALLGMLNSCASNVTVVNIDAGFKGGYLAGLIAQRKVGF